MSPLRSPVRVHRLGNGKREAAPGVAVVAGVHGDEPCGVRAIERLLAERPAVERPVDLVVANERALAAGRRYVDADLERSFPGDPDAPTPEGRLAAALSRALAGRTVLSLGSTRSHPEPFAVVDRAGGDAAAVCPHLPVAAVVETGGLAEGRLFAAAPTVEWGRQGTDRAADNAARVVRAFLAATGVLPGAERRRAKENDPHSSGGANSTSVRSRSSMQ